MTEEARKAIDRIRSRQFDTNWCQAMTVEAREAVDRIRKGNLIECSAETYRSEIRDAIIRFASHCADNNDAIRMRIALAEVSRLDKMHGYGPLAESPDKLT